MKIPALTAVAALSVLLIAGCGGDNKSVTATSGSGSGTATTTAASSSATTTGGATATSSRSGGDSGSTTTPSFSGDSNNEFCQTARDLESSNIGSALSGEGDLKTTLQTAKKALDDLKSTAPADIRADVNTLADAFDKLDQFYAKYDYDQQKLLEAAQKDPAVLQQATSAITDSNFEAAAARVTAYGTQVCGLSDDSSSTSA
jgi:hypothetical protein